MGGDGRWGILLKRGVCRYAAMQAGAFMVKLIMAEYLAAEVDLERRVIDPGRTNRRAAASGVSEWIERPARSGRDG